jgi:ABC-type sugar transport system permease subunit
LTVHREHPVVSPSRPGAAFKRVWDKEWLSAYRFLALPLGVLVFIKLYPFAYNFVLSLTDGGFLDPLTFVGLSHFRELVDDQTIRNATYNTLYLAALVVPLGTAMSLGAAVVVNDRFPGRAMVRLGFVLPMVTSVVVGSMVWELIYLPRGGLLNTVAGTQGVDWLQNPNLALPSVALVILWSTVGLNVLVFLASLQDVSPALLDSAAIDGANRFQQFIHVILPGIKRTLLFVVATLTIVVFRSFGVIFVLTQGGPVQRTNTLVWEVYLNAFSYLRFNRAAALSVVMVLIILVITFFYFRILRSDD